jgi:DNA-binding CsgD family transcriptional regulator
MTSTPPRGYRDPDPPQTLSAPHKGEVAAPFGESRLDTSAFDQVYGGSDQELEGLYSLIGQKCVALALEAARHIFAQSLVRAMTGQTGQASPQNAGPLDNWSYLATTWRGTWENGEITILEQIIALGFDAQPIPPQPDQVTQTAVEGLGTATHGERCLPAPPYPDELTAREVEVLCLLATGLTNSELADRLYLSRRTVHAHLRSIYSKIGVNTRAAATRYAVLHGFAT